MSSSKKSLRRRAPRPGGQRDYPGLCSGASRAVNPGKFVTRTRQELDLLDAAAVRAFFDAERPTHVVVAAAKVGGIKANNDFPVDFLLDNLKPPERPHRVRPTKPASPSSSSWAAVLHLPQVRPAAHQRGLPAHRPAGADQRAPTPSPRSRASSSARPTASQYGADFISAMPTNMYGPFDNFDLVKPRTSCPAMIHKFHLAKDRAAAPP